MGEFRDAAREVNRFVSILKRINPNDQRRKYIQFSRGWVDWARIIVVLEIGLAEAYNGHTYFHSELSWQGDEWIEWSDDHPEFAAVLWPMVLKVLRSDLPPDVARMFGESIVLHAKYSDDIHEFNRLLKADPDLSRLSL